MHTDIRELMCDLCYKMWQKDWVAANDGNLSALLPDGTLLCTPTGFSKSLIKPHMLVRIDREGNVLEAGSGYRPSSEIKLHLRCYQARPDVAGVVHAHPPYATAYAAAGIALTDYSMTETVATLGQVPLAPYATPSTREVPDSVAPYLQNHDAVLLKNHGALAVGGDLVSAFYRMETVEHYAKVSLFVHLLGGPDEISPQNVRDLIQLRTTTYHATGRHPGYDIHHRHQIKE